MTAYYNEFDKNTAAWLRELIRNGIIAPGVVDTRSIEDVRPADLEGFNQCHFFAGIGVWSFALRAAGWPDDRPVWTGSCPCQPFSTAGQGAAFDDERHLWPAFHHLIRQRRPPAIFGEQVASKDVDPWIDLVQDDLEGVGYRFGAIPFPSAGVGAPHIRDRLYWMADTKSERWDRPKDTARSERGISSQASRPISGLGNPILPGRQPIKDGISGNGARVESARCFTIESSETVSDVDRSIPTDGFWRDAEWLGCRDGKWRPVEPGTFPLADGAAARVLRLRGYGNAINASAAKTWIETVMECEA